jgi:hypothetical protein
MSTSITPSEKTLRDELAVATTWEQFGAALQKFRRTVRPVGLSLRRMERRPGCLSRSAISARETGKYLFAEQELPPYLHACKATTSLIDYCITQHRRIAQSPPSANLHESHTQKPSFPMPTALTAPAVSVVLEIPDPDAEIKRLQHKANSHGKSGEPLKAANIAAEAVTISETIYGPEHPTTLDARRQQLWWASEVFTQSCRSLSKQWDPFRRQRKEHERNATDLRRSWETLIGSFRQVYGSSHRETLQVRRWYADSIRKTCYRENGLSSAKLYREIIVDLMDDATYSLGHTDDLTLDMQWALADADGTVEAWRKLYLQWHNKLGNHPRTKAAEDRAEEARMKYVSWAIDTGRIRPPSGA